MKQVTIYSDGACRGNPGPGGYGSILVYGNHRKEISGYSPDTTNNKMEMTAVMEGLKLLKEPCAVDVYSDSRYVVDAFNKGWVYNWKKKNWMASKTEPRKNSDLWKDFLELTEKHKVTFHWIKGHAGHPENERCDQLANLAINNNV